MQPRWVLTLLSSCLTHSSAVTKEMHHRDWLRISFSFKKLAIFQGETVPVAKPDDQAPGPTAWLNVL